MIFHRQTKLIPKHAETIAIIQKKSLIVDTIELKL